MIEETKTLQSTPQAEHHFPKFTQEPIQLIDEAGNWVAPFAIDVDEEFVKQLYREMLLSRLVDERYSKLQRTGKVRFMASSAGHEAAQVAVPRAMRAGFDWLFPYYRDVGLVLSAGITLTEYFGQLMGTKVDLNKGRQMPGHPSSKALNIFTPCSAIASHLPPAAGAGIGMKLRGTQQVSVVTFGDGATSEGEFHTACNFASVQQAPVIFVCENNGYAISLPIEQQSASTTMAIKGEAYGMPGYTVDGMDVLACFYVMRERIDAARAGQGPSLVDLQVYRYGPHSSADDDLQYRTQEEIDDWKQRDPIMRLERYMLKQGYWTQAWHDALKVELEEEIKRAAKASEASGIAPDSWLFDDVYADLPWHLQEQKAQAFHKTQDKS